MPAAAVIPAPIAYIKIVAVKTLVVGYLFGDYWSTPVVSTRCIPDTSLVNCVHFTVRAAEPKLLL